MSLLKKIRDKNEELRTSVKTKLESASEIDVSVKSSICEVLQFLGRRPLQGLLTLLNNHPQWTPASEIKVFYDHSPRVLGDLKDFGIPILGENRSHSGSDEKVYHYRLGEAEHVLRQPLKGRSALRKSIKRSLLTEYGSRDALTGIAFPPASLQIDHRIPFRIAGDTPGNLTEDRFMLLSASSQRAKAMACKRCANMTEAIQHQCETCYWARPQDYEHVELTPARAITIVWTDADKDTLFLLKSRAAKNDITLDECIKIALREAVIRAELVATDE